MSKATRLTTCVFVTFVASHTLAAEVECGIRAPLQCSQDRVAPLAEVSGALAAEARGKKASADGGSMRNTAAQQAAGESVRPTEAQVSFHLESLQLQAQIEREARAYAAISHALKKQHETAQNIISNIL